MIITYDGLDHYAGSGDLQIRAGKLQWFCPAEVGGTVLISPTGGREGSGALQLECRYFGLGPVQTSVQGFFLNSDATIIIGMALDLHDWADPLDIYFQDALASNAEQIHFHITSGPTQVSIYRGATLLVASPINAFTTGSYNFFEFKSLTNTTTGSATVRINGQVVATVSGVNTQQTANASVSALQILGGTSNTTAVNVFIDDVYICNGISSGGLYPANDFLGDVHVETLFPIGNSTVTWTPQFNTNWVEVSETAFDGDSSFNFTSTINNTDSLSMGSLPITVSGVIAVQATGAYRKSGAGSHSLAQGISSSGTIASGATVSLSESYQYLSDLFLHDPSTGGNWLIPAVNALLGTYTLIS